LDKNIAKNNDPVFRAQIETYKYYQNKVELLDETFRNSSLFYLEYKWKCKTIIKNDQHKKYAAIDIGSNAMRLLIVISSNRRKRANSIKVP
jgi:hypothetical protein